MQNYSISHLRPDSLTGAVCAIEGIRGACAVINGPTGCKYFTSYFVDQQDPQGSSIDPKEFQDRFYLGQPRAPSTYVDEKDYIHGANAKLVPLLRLLNQRNLQLIGIVNSPGMALIGDDVRGAIRKAEVGAKTVVVEGSGFTGSYAKGFKTALLEVLRVATQRSTEKIPKSVNLLGPSIGHYNWQNDVEELRRMLGAMGVKVLSVLSAGEDFGSVEQAGRAELNLVIYEEYGNEVAEFMKSEFDIPFLSLETLAPYGPDACKIWCSDIANALGLDPSPAERDMVALRKRCYSALVRATSVSGLPKGAEFAIFADSSLVAPFLTFLHNYLGMYPTLIGLREVGKVSRSFIEQFLKDESINCKVLANPDQYEIQAGLADEGPDLIFGSSIEQQISKTIPDLKSHYVHITAPVWGRVTITHRPIIGINGTLTIVEEIVNNLCGHAFSA